MQIFRELSSVGKKQLAVGNLHFHPKLYQILKRIQRNINLS